MYECWDCGGTGVKQHYAMIKNGVCFTCHGTGKTNKIPSAIDYHEPKASDYCEAHGLLGCNECENKTNEKVELTMENSLFKTVSIRTLAEIARVSYDGKGGFYHQELKDCASRVYQAYQRNTIVNKVYVLNVIKQLTFFKLVKHEWLGEVGDYSELYLAPTERGIEQLKKYYPDIMERIHNAYMEQQRKYAEEEFENEASLEDEAERRENVNNESIIESPAGIIGFRDGIE